MRGAMVSVGAALAGALLLGGACGDDATTGDCPGAPEGVCPPPGGAGGAGGAAGVAGVGGGGAGGAPRMGMGGGGT